MANRSLGTLTYNLVAQIGGFTSGMTEAERQAAKSAKAINDQIETIGVASYAVGTALGQYLKQGIDLAIGAFPKLIDSVAQFQDIADKTGGSASGFAAFAVSAKTADVSIDEIASASTKLSKALLQAGDDTKPITAGLTALGINIKDFKALAPDQQIKAVAEAFGGFADGANKAAVAQQIFGKSGADLLKFFADYTSNGGDVNILTDEMIKQADDFTDASKRASAELEQYAGLLAVQVLPALTAFKTTVTDAIKEVLGLGGASDSLGQSTGVQDFAEKAVKALGFIIDAADGVKRVFEVLGTSIAGAAATAVSAAHGEFQGALAAAQAAHADIEKILDAPQFSTKLAKNIAAGKKAIDDARTNAFYGIGGDNRPTLPATPPAKKGGSGPDPDALIKDQLNAQLDQIKNFAKVQQDAAQNNQKILEAMHSAGLTSDQDYYAQRKQLVQQDTQIQVDSLNAQIAALQSVSFTGKNAAKDQIDNQKKIADAQTQLTKVQADGATQVQVLGIQAESAYRKMAVALIAARQSAQDFFDTTNKGYANTLAGIGQGDKQREFLNGINAVNDRYQQQRQAIQNSRVQATAQAGGKLDPAVAKQFDDQLAIIEEFNGKALASYKDFYAQQQAAQKDWLNGAQDALKNYADAAGNTAELTKGVFDDAFKGLEDTLTTFLTTGKADWKSFANSIIADIDRILIKQLLLGPLASQLSSMLGGGSGGSSGGLGGLFGSLFGGGGGGGGDVLGDFISANGFASGGYTGAGAANDPAGFVHRGEVVWSQADIARSGGLGNVMALRRGQGGDGLTVNFAVQPGQVDQRTQTQIANQVRRTQQGAAARFG